MNCGLTGSATVLSGVDHFDGATQIYFESDLVILVSEEFVEGTIEYFWKLAISAFLPTKFAKIASTFEVIDVDIYAYFLCE